MTRPKSSRWSEFEIEQLKRLAAKGVSARQIGRLLNRREHNVNQRARMHGVEIQRKWSFVRWTNEMLAYLRDRYPHDTAISIAAHLKISTGSVHSKARKLGLKKTAQFWESDKSGRVIRGKHSEAMKANQFKKGHVPANKGKKMSAENYVKCAPTMFKKGRKAEESHNYVPIGTERMTRDGYIEVKVTDDPTLVTARRWVMKHRLIWEAANGPIPEGHIVCFIDNNRQNVMLENLVLRTMAENASITATRFHTEYPEDYRELVSTRASLTRRINKKLKQLEEQQ